MGIVVDGGSATKTRIGRAMSENTKIQWASHTFNCWRGCSKVNAGCTNCYAEVNRSVKIHGVKWGTEKQGGTRVRLSDAGWKEPLKWNRQAACNCNSAIGKSHMEAFATCPQHSGNGRPRVFCASLADVFEDWQSPILDHNGLLVWRYKVGNEWKYVGAINRPSSHDCELATMNDLRADLFWLIDATPNLDWMILTKRPENIRRMCPSVFGDAYRANADNEELNVHPREHRPNIWLGTSCSDQATFDKAVDELVKCRNLSPVLFVSEEPLLGPIDNSRHLGIERDRDGSWRKRTKFCESSLIDLIITGGESGSNARPCNVDWIRGILDQCRAAGTACFVKQLGSVPVCDGTVRQNDAHDGPGTHREHIPLRLNDSKGGDMNEWSEDLRVRQIP